MRHMLLLLAIGCKEQVKSTAIVEEAEMGESLADRDGDGYLSDEDCDEENNTVNPGSIEVCDGVDNNCDGQIDEDVSTTYYLDSDMDGFGDMEEPVEACSQPEGHVGVASDCDDADPSSHPGAEEICDGTDNDCDGEVDDGDGMDGLWYADADGDGYGANEEPVAGCSPGPGHVQETGDCNDLDPAVNPFGNEICNGIDDDCDGYLDEGLLSTYYQDSDADGFGDMETTTEACAQPEGYVDNAQDCDDLESFAHPGAEEICDGIDNDCNGETDENSADGNMEYYADSDADGFGDPASPLTACAQPAGHVPEAGDCDDGDPLQSPEADELCNGEDDDCDGDTDEESAVDALEYYQDGDGDGFGNPGEPQPGCQQPVGHVLDGTDCDDANPMAMPGADELCNGFDDDCDGDTDEGDASDASLYYEDADGDGYGLSETEYSACEMPAGHASHPGDCDDASNSQHPGAEEYCNGEDDDCDGDTDEGDAANASVYYQDADGDGFGDPAQGQGSCEQPSGQVLDSTDCDDAEPMANPGAEEYCNGFDDDCDGGTDESDAADAILFYGDADGDGYGTAATGISACLEPSGHALLPGDCDDANNSQHPGADEYCNGEDDDCDGDTDEADAVNATLFYEDEDSDGFGDLADGVASCTEPGGYVADGTDCDDRDASISPDALESCNGEDDDCDGDTDEGAADAALWFADTDGDDFGDLSAPLSACTQPIGYVADSTDCDDALDSVSPGALEVCNGFDDDCDGDTDDADSSLEEAPSWALDHDGDGYGDPGFLQEACLQQTGYVSEATDCDDLDADTSPAGTEVCDGTDNDCDGDTDEGVTPVWYMDGDGDGFGQTGSTAEVCDRPDGYVAEPGDCNDADELSSPDAIEFCDGDDNDCDGDTDEGLYQDWYVDYDGDGFGDPGISFYDCETPALFVGQAGDCNDLDATINPDAEPGCGDIDMDCDGAVDSDADGDGYSDSDCGGSDCDDEDPDALPGAAELEPDICTYDGDGDGYGDIELGGTDCDDGNPEILPDVGGGCPLGGTCNEIQSNGYDEGDGVYTIDPDGHSTGLDPFEVYCDMTTDGGGWTEIAYSADLPFQQHFSNGDGYRWLGYDFGTVLSEEQILGIQDLSSEGRQTYVGLCNGVIHYYYNDGGNHSYSLGFQFIGGATTSYASASYAPYSISVTQDGCATNGGEGGSAGLATVFEIESLQVPVTSVACNDCGDSGEQFGSPLSENPAWLR
jgi:large repetitive protein